jgi:hypothetical protein
LTVDAVRQSPLGKAAPQKNGDGRVRSICFNTKVRDPLGGEAGLELRDVF